MKSQSKAELHKILEQQQNFEELLLEISTQFISLPVESIDGAIEDAQRRICKILHFDLSALWQWSDRDHHILTITHLYSPPNGPERPVDINAADTFPWSLEMMKAGEPLNITTENLPDEADVDRESRRFFGVKSSVGLPIKEGGKPIMGLISFDTLHEERNWSRREVGRLQLVAEIFTNALVRKRYEQKLKNNLAVIELLKKQLEQENYYLREDLRQEQGFEQVIGQSRPFKAVLTSAGQVASTSATVLLLGETGTGKGVIAHAIHRMSDRSDQPFVTVNCAALPYNLIESELFGRVKGAFTGADAKQAGRFEVADGGTLFLDEIGELPLEIQAKLLRVLQEAEFERLGSPETVKVDVRVIAATAHDLIDDVKNGRFREDLFYRLNVFPITLPPLRQRTDDIPLLAQYFVEKYGRKMSRDIDRIPKPLLDKMLHYPWPGNVRELEHLIERSVIISSGSSLSFSDQFFTMSPASVASSTIRDLQSVERDHIQEVLIQTNWKIEGPGGAASILDLHPSTLRFRLKKLGIKRPF